MSQFLVLRKWDPYAYGADLWQTGTNRLASDSVGVQTILLYAVSRIYTSFINIMIMSMELELEWIKIISSICNKGTRNTIPISKPVTSWTQVRCVNLLHSSYDLSVGTLQKFLSTLKPSRNWGPVDTMDRHWWVQWRVTRNKTGRRDFTFKRRGTKDYTSSIQKYHTTDPAGTYRATPSSANGTLQNNRGTNRGPFTIQTNGALPEHVCWRGTLQQGGDGT